MYCEHHVARALTAALVALFACTPLARGEEAEPKADHPSPSRRGPPTETVVTLTPRASYAFETRVRDRDDDARLSVARAGGSANVAFSPVMALRVEVDATFLHSRYSWRNPAGLGAPEVAPAADPWDDLTSGGLSIGAQVFLGPRWSVTLRSSVSAGIENGADFGKSIQGGGGLGVGYRFDNGLLVAFGLNVFTRIEDSPIVLPLIFVVWQITDDLTLDTPGPAVRLSWRVREGVKLFASAGGAFGQWRLDDRRAVLPSGILSDVRFPVSGGVAWAPLGARLTVRVEGGAFAYQELRLQDRRGEAVRVLRPRQTGWMGLEVALSF